MKADYQLLQTYVDILDKGVGDFDQQVRPKWQDGTPAHTFKVFGQVQRYNLQEEFPLSSVRKLNWKCAIDEILWIWQKKSYNIKDLNSKIWDQWANKGEHPDQEIGSIGKAYGYQMGDKKVLYNGEYVDMVDYMLSELKTNPGNRRILTEIFNHSQLHEMNLAPCVHEATFNVSNGYLNMVLNQRSHDTLAAGSWNVVQYAALLCMIAQSSGLKPGEMVHVVTDSHCYDRHVPMELQIIAGQCSIIQKRLMEKASADLIKAVEEKDVYDNLLEILKICNKKGVDFDAFISMAKLVENTNVDYQELVNHIRKDETFNATKTIIQIMLQDKRLHKALDFSQPKMIIDPNVDNFYNFNSPLMRTGSALEVKDGQFVREGQIVDNPNSSFHVEDYHPETDGVKLSGRVPVAE